MTEGRQQFWANVVETDRFFEGRSKVHRTLRSLVRRLAKEGIDYVVIGGMALNALGLRRVTMDIDLVLTAAGLEQFEHRLVGKSYESVQGRRRRFLDPKTGVTFDILLAGRYPGDGKPKPVTFPDPASAARSMDDAPGTAAAKPCNFVPLETFIELKLAARRWRDFDDVVRLIRAHDLDESFAEKLDPSVRPDYVECLEERRREDEYEARMDRD